MLAPGGKDTFSLDLTLPLFQHKIAIPQTKFQPQGRDLFPSPNVYPQGGEAFPLNLTLNFLDKLPSPRLNSNP